MSSMFNAEQAMAGMRDLAMMMRTYYDELLTQGFTKQQAMMMVIEFQKVTLSGGAK